MIVVDTNVIAYLFINGEKTEVTRRVFQKDPHWVVPLLWRSEFRSVLYLYMRKCGLNITDALELMGSAETLLEGNEFQVNSGQVLGLAGSSNCSAYDCEFVALSQELNVPLVTSDSQIIEAFPKYAVSLKDFASN